RRTEVDASVEEAEARIAAWVVRRVQAADDGRDVRLEETDAEDDQREREVEHLQRHLVAYDDAVDARRGLALDRHAEMAEHEQDAAEHDRLAHAEPAIRDEPADHRHRIYEPAVRADQVVAVLVGEQ